MMYPKDLYRGWRCKNYCTIKSAPEKKAREDYLKNLKTLWENNSALGSGRKPLIVYSSVGMSLRKKKIGRQHSEN